MITITNSIQLQEYSRGGGEEDRAHDSASGYRNVFNVGYNSDNGRYVNGYNLNLNYRLNAGHLVALRVATLFVSLSLLLRGSFLLFLQLAVPPAELFAHFIDLFR